VRPTMPSLLSGKDREFDRANILAAVGDKHRSLRGAWLPLFYAGRRAPPLLSGGALLQHSSTSLANPDPKCMPPA